MAESKHEFISSQDSVLHSSQELLSQETFELIWGQMSHDLLVDTLALSNSQLDSSNIENDQQDVPLESIIPRDLQANDMAVSQVPMSVASADSSAQQGSSSLPACETWPGQYDFKVSFSPQDKNTKGIAWTYSQMKDKLYVKKDAPCPINFSASSFLPNGVNIRVMALYTSPEQVTEIVQRCINHSMEESRIGRVEAEHLIRCESSMTTYHTDRITGRHSVVVPFENPSVGQNYSTYIYKFACFGSCSGGPNRRPLMLIFTLERGNQVIGRRKLDVKICACPGRDRRSDEGQYKPVEVVEAPDQPTMMPGKRKMTSDLANLSDVMDFTKGVYFPKSKKVKAAPKDGIYSVNTDDVSCYEFLKQMKKLYIISHTLKNTSPEVLQTAFICANQKFKNEKNY